MRRRRVLLCLPDQPSSDALTLAQVVKAALEKQRSPSTRFHLEVPEDDDQTPLDGFVEGTTLVLRIEEPPDGGESDV